MPEFTGMTIPTVFSVVQRKGSGESWFGTYDGGIFAYHKGKRVRNLTPENLKFLGSCCVSALYEDKDANCWVGKMCIRDRHEYRRLYESPEVVGTFRRGDRHCLSSDTY